MALFAYVWYGSFSQGLAINSIIDVTTYIKQDFVDTLNLSTSTIGNSSRPFNLYTFNGSVGYYYFNLVIHV